MAKAPARKRRGLVLLWLRRSSQVLLLGLFVALLVLSTYPVSTDSDGPATRAEAPVELFFQLDPFVALISLLSSHQLAVPLLASLAVIALTLLVGRGPFCGWGICPLGTLNQAASWALGARSAAERRRRNQPSNSQRIKLLVLAFCLGAAVLGSAVGGWLDPISIATRGVGLFLLPAVDTALAGGPSSAGGDEGILDGATAAVSGLMSAAVSYRPQHFQGGWLLGGVLLLILAANAYRPRFWCRTLCPLGALLGQISRLSILGMKKDHEACIDCGKCQDHCQGADEPRGRKDWRESECVLCLNCRRVCPTDVITFAFSPGRPPAPTAARRRERRHLLGAAAAGAALIPLSRLDAGPGLPPPPKLIRPPGARPEREFLERCVRCGQCSKACPTNVLQPALTTGGLEGLSTPMLVMRFGYCEPSCVACGQVCPTGAIRAVSAEEKLGRSGDLGPIRIGTAALDTGRCLPWSAATPCIVCEEFCPATPKAIWVEQVTERDRHGREVLLARPRVDRSRCTGCGACEHVCPLRSMPAIRVTSDGESRSTDSGTGLVERPG